MNYYDKARRLNEIKERIEKLNEEALSLFDGTSLSDNAYRGFYGGIQRALSPDNQWVGRDYNTIEQLAEELQDYEDEE